MRVASIELPALFGDVAANLARVDALLRAVAGSVDLALLPELALTGYVSPSLEFDVTRFAEPLEGPTCLKLAALAKKHGVALCGPLVERAGDRLYNALVGFERDGRLAMHYRKRHPWMPERWATPGDLPHGPFTLAGARVAVAICYDIHFLLDGTEGYFGARADDAEARNALHGADVLLFPSAWVDEGGDGRGALLPELARRYGVAVVNANWGPGLPRIRGQGTSRIIAADGRELVRVGSGERPSIAAAPLA